MVRNGSHAEREVSTAAGAVPVRAPQVNDKRIDEETGRRRRFASAILPAWARKSRGRTQCSHHQPDRVDLHHRASPSAGHQRPGSPAAGVAMAFKLIESARTGTLASRERTPPRRPGPSRSQVRERRPPRATRREVRKRSASRVTRHPQVLTISHARVTSYVWPTVTIGDAHLRFGDSGSSDALCAFITHHVVGSEESPESGLVIRFRLGDVVANPEPTDLGGRRSLSCRCTRTPFGTQRGWFGDRARESSPLATWS